MFPSPYRNLSGVRSPKGLRKRAIEDGFLLTVLGLFWAVSILRVVGGLMRHEVFGAEGTLALLAVLFVPWLIWDRPARRSLGNDRPLSREPEDASVGEAIRIGANDGVDAL